MLFIILLMVPGMGTTYCSSQPQTPVAKATTVKAVKEQLAMRKKWQRRKTLSYDAVYKPLWAKVQKFIVKGDEPMTMFDVGMNTGKWGRIMSERWMKSGVSYHGFEPFKGNYERAQNYLRNKSGRTTHLVNAALSNETGEKELFLPSDSEEAEAGNEHFSLGQQSAQGKAAKAFTIKTIRLDDYVLGRAGSPAVPRIDVLKMDVEGFEPIVLSGAQHVLSVMRPPVVFMECSWMWQTNHPVGYSLKYMTSLFNRYGYDFFTINPSNKGLQTRLLMFVGEPFYDPEYETHLAWNNCLAISSDAKNRDKFLTTEPFAVMPEVLPYLTRPADGKCKPNPSRHPKDPSLEPGLLAKNGSLGLSCMPSPCKFRTDEQYKRELVRYKAKEEAKRKRKQKQKNEKRVTVPHH